MTKYIRDKDTYCPECNTIAVWIGVIESGGAKYYCPKCHFQWNLNEIYTRNVIKK